MLFFYSKGNIFFVDNKVGIFCKLYWSLLMIVGDVEVYCWVLCMKGFCFCWQIFEGCWRVGLGYCVGMVVIGLKDCRGSVFQYEKYGIWVFGVWDEDWV